MRTIVVGAGIAGLAAARRLVSAGHDVSVLDKGRSPGGRLATRRIAGARLDHGAQFFTVRGDEWGAQVSAWRAEQLVGVWCHGFGEPDGHPRYVARAGMNSLAKSLAADLDVTCDRLVFTIRPNMTGWDVVTDDGAVQRADAVVVTCPLPQAFALLVESEVAVPDSLFGTDYDRTIALLAVLDRPSAIPPPGGMPASELAGTPFSFVADNLAKGVSDVAAVTLHANPTWSLDHWDRPADEVLDSLTTSSAPFLGDAEVVESQLKRWRFATPRQVWPEPCWASAAGTLVVAGDAFAGPKSSGSNLEGAFMSGLAAAEVLRSS